jgi:two-component system response regulator RegA
MSGQPKRIVVCDDDATFRRRLVRSLRDRGKEVYEAEDAQHGLEVCMEYQPDGLLVDLRMPGEGGLWLVEQVGQALPGCTIVVLTGFGSITTALDAVRRGAVNYITKPTSLDQILNAFSPQTTGTSREVAMPSLAEVEAEYVQRVLNECEGNVSQSAKVLGVHRRSLQRKLRKESGV